MIQMINHYSSCVDYFGQLKAALNESRKNASLLAEYHALYELQRKRLEKQASMMAGEKEIWSSAAYSLALKVGSLFNLNFCFPQRVHVIVGH